MLIHYGNDRPLLGQRCFVADNAAVIGAVTMGDDCSVWFGASVRGDIMTITVGDRSNIQDSATIHNSTGRPTVIGSDVTIGHNAVVHSATVEDGVLIGMGAVVLDGAVVGAGSVVGAGAVVTKGTVIPPNSLVTGIPARVVRELPPESNLENAREYLTLKDRYLTEREAAEQ